MDSFPDAVGCARARGIPRSNQPNPPHDRCIDHRKKATELDGRRHATGCLSGGAEMLGGEGWDRRCPACICGWSRRRAECAASKRSGAEKERLGEWPSAELAATFETVCGTATSVQASHNFQCTLGKARQPAASYSYLFHGSGSVLSKGRVDCEEVALRIFPLDRALQASHNSKSPPHSVPAKQ